MNALFESRAAGAAPSPLSEQSSSRPALAAAPAAERCPQLCRDGSGERAYKQSCPRRSKQSPALPWEGQSPWQERGARGGG